MSFRGHHKYRRIKTLQKYEIEHAACQELIQISESEAENQSHPHPLRKNTFFERNHEYPFHKGINRKKMEEKKYYSIDQSQNKANSKFPPVFKSNYEMERQKEKSDFDIKAALKLTKYVIVDGRTRTQSNQQWKGWLKNKFVKGSANFGKSRSKSEQRKKLLIRFGRESLGMNNI